MCLCGDSECPSCGVAQNTYTGEQEVKAAARDLARRGLSGKAGDPLPNLMSAVAVDWINAHQTDFEEMVTSYRLARAIFGENRMLEETGNE